MLGYCCLEGTLQRYKLGLMLLGEVLKVLLVLGLELVVVRELLDEGGLVDFGGFEALL